MKDFHYHQHAADLDRRLEKVIAETSTKEASPDDTSLGLQAFIERTTIAEEIAATRSKAASVEGNLNVIRAREKVAEIVEERTSRFDAFSSLAQPMVEAFTKQAADQAEFDARREELRQL